MRHEGYAFVGGMCYRGKACMPSSPAHGHMLPTDKFFLARTWLVRAGKFIPSLCAKGTPVNPELKLPPGRVATPGKRVPKPVPVMLNMVSAIHCCIDTCRRKKAHTISHKSTSHNRCRWPRQFNAKSVPCKSQVPTTVSSRP